MEGPVKREEIVDIRFDALDEDGNEKKYVTIKEIFDAVVKAYQIDFAGANTEYDENNYRDNLYKIIQRALITNKKSKDERKKQVDEKIQKGYLVKNSKEYKIAIGYARSVLCDDRFIESIYKFGFTGENRGPRLKTIKDLRENVERNNKSYQAYMESGQNIADMRQARLESDTTGIQAAIDKGIEDRKKDIIIGFSMEKLIDSPELKEEFRKANEGAIDDVIREKTLEIVVKYILENYIDLDETLLAQDVTVTYISDLNPGELGIINEAAIERLQDLGNYYKERNNGGKK